MKAAALDAFDAVAGFGEKVSGHVRMSVPTISGETAARRCGGRFLPAAPRAHGGDVPDNRFVNLVEEGFDLVIRTGYLDDSSLIARHILDSQWVICAAPAYVRRFGAPREPSDLLTHNCLHYAYQSTGASGGPSRGRGQLSGVGVGELFNRQRRGPAQGGAGGAASSMCRAVWSITT